MTSPQEQAQELERLRFESHRSVVAMAEIIAGHDVGNDLSAAMDHLSKSPVIGARADTPFPQLESLTDEQEADIRTEAHKLGVDAEKSVGLKERGLPKGATVISENGLPNKVLAPFFAITEGEVQPGVVVMPASATRIAGTTDVQRMGQIAEKRGIDAPDIAGRTELENTPVIASLHPDFVGQEPEVLPIGYELYDGGVGIVEESTGQVVLIGWLKDSPVVTVETRELHRDDSGKNFFRPGPAHLKDLARRIAAHFDEAAADLPAATMTSHLYGRSRILQDPDTITYGTEAMAQVIPVEPAAMNQIVAEAHRIGEVLQESSRD